MRRLALLLLCLLAGCAPRPVERRALELYLARQGQPGLELPDLLPITHPLLLRQTLAGADGFRQELGAYLRHPSLRLVDTRMLELPRGRASRELAVGTAGTAAWALDVRRERGHRQVQLRVTDKGVGEVFSGWTDLGEREDLVLGMPLAGDASLLLRLPPAGAPPAEQGTPALPESLLAKAPFRKMATPPELVGGPEQLGLRIKYPPAALRDGVEGTVLLALLVGKHGDVQETSLLRGVRADLDSAAAAAMRGVSFVPGRDARGPVAAWVTVPVRFKLESKAPAGR